jgi:sarcosine oxidase subunit gamma
MVSKLTQCNLSLQPNQSDGKAGRIALCLGPDEYLILVEQGREIQLEKILNSSDIIKQISVTNVSDALCALSLSGKKVRDLLAKGCAIDLHPDSFGKNQSAQCDLALSNVILICLEEDAFICICRTSFAEYVLDWCLDAGFEFGIFASAGI